MSVIHDIEFPKRFKGFFQRCVPTYAPLIAESRQQLRLLDHPDELRPFYSYVTQANPQPSFLLLPLIYLAFAEASGGITARHQAYLAVLMLSMEAVAIMDDTVDASSIRSGRPTFPAQFGSLSSTPMVATIMALVAQQTITCDVRLLQPTMQFFIMLGSLELWEFQHLYPEIGLFEPWLQRRYEQGHVAIELAISTALMLNNHEPLPQEVYASFAQIMQDVDDSVNVVEAQDPESEICDFKMGRVTQPLLQVIAQQPARLAVVNDLWSHYRRDREADLETTAAYQQITRALLHEGVPATIDLVGTTAEICVGKTPPVFRPLMREMVDSFVQRLASVTPATRAQPTYPKSGRNL